MSVAIQKHYQKYIFYNLLYFPVKAILFRGNYEVTRKRLE